MSPNAIAIIEGNASNPNLHGQVCFCKTMNGGVLITAELFGLPDSFNKSNFYGMHIHEFGDCGQDFQRTGNHFNPENMPHPMHTGDLPALLSNQGYAWMSFFDRRFTIDDIIGKSIVIHNMQDDFTSQPSGNSGAKIGCGVIINNQE